MARFRSAQLTALLGMAWAASGLPRPAMAESAREPTGVATAASRWEFVEPHMGTLFRIVIFAPEVTAAKSAAKAAFARVAALNRVMSDYDPDSELMRLCRQPAGTPVKISPELCDILHRSQRLSETSEGAFDVTLGPVIRLWREARRQKKLPAEESRKAALLASGYRKLRLDLEGQTVTLLAAGMQLDLGGIAKGYAADAALTVLARHGFRRAMVEASGDIALGEPPPESDGWKVQLAPFGSDPAGSILVTAANAGISTSGDAEQFLELGGVRYSHIVDPATGLGLTRPVAVTVVARHATLSDGLATACSVLSPAAVKPLIEKLNEPVRILVQTRNRNGAVQRRSFGTNPPGVSFPL